jgi:hypothetical protein
LYGREPPVNPRYASGGGDPFFRGGSSRAPLALASNNQLMTDHRYASNRYRTDYGGNMVPVHEPRHVQRRRIIHPRPDSPALRKVWGAAKAETIQGGALKTWSFLSHAVDRVQVVLATEGRPLDATVELWQVSLRDGFGYKRLCLTILAYLTHILTRTLGTGQYSNTNARLQ